MIDDLLSEPETFYIGGQWRESTGGESIQVWNPATGNVLTTVPSATAEEATDAIDAAEAASTEWKQLPAKERGDVVRSIASTMESYAGELAKLVSLEQGKPISTARGEIQGAIALAEYMAGWDRRIEGDIVPADGQRESIHIQRVPLGVVAGLIPWNFPITVFVRKLAPALVTGNTFVGKPSEITSVATMRLVELIDDNVELPDGVLNVVTGGGDVGAELVMSNQVDLITITGNVETGKEIMRDAADNLTRVSLELGGKAPAVIWRDADVDQAVEDVLTARIANTGQVCTCAERVYVHAEVRDEFQEKYVEAVENLTIGLPTENPDIGPQVSERELTKTESAVERARDRGADILTGGSPPDGEMYSTGYWYEPTVISGVGQDWEIMQEEIFGPVTPIMEVNDLDEALDYANDSRYGLSSYLYTDSYRVAMRFAEEVECGELYLNRSIGESWQGHHVGWDESGIGGEDGKHGVHKYTKLKTIYHNYQ